MPQIVNKTSFLAVFLAIVLCGTTTALISRNYKPTSPSSFGSRYRQDTTFTKTKVTQTVTGLPQITHVQIIDRDGDGQAEIIACDALNNCIWEYKIFDDYQVKHTKLIENTAVPAHTTFVDIDKDGDLDCIVSILGDLFPNDDPVGRIELFRNNSGHYEREILLDDIRRVADVQPADFDADGDIDLAVAVFGYSRGEILWLENLADGTFSDHQLLSAAGGIHVPIADYDLDGDPDIATIISQDSEELWAFENLGNGDFKSRMLWRTPNFDLGSAGLIHADIDNDGDEDFILPAGDNLEDFAAFPQPYHGCYWFENTGSWNFTEHRISDLGGTYAADAGDLDNDGDIDICLVSMTNNWLEPQNASIVWLENDGQQNFTTWQIDSDPIHLITVSIGDINGNGKQDIVAGGLNIRFPYERATDVTVWLNKEITK